MAGGNITPKGWPKQRYAKYIFPIAVGSGSQYVDFDLYQNLAGIWVADALPWY